MEDRIGVMERQAELGFYLLFLPREPRDDQNLPGLQPCQGLSLGRIGLLSGSSLHTRSWKDNWGLPREPKKDTHGGTMEGMGRNVPELVVPANKRTQVRDVLGRRLFPNRVQAAGARRKEDLDV